MELFFVFSPRLIKFSVHGRILSYSYVVFQNIVIIAVLTVDLFSPSQLLSVHVCKGLEFGSKHFTGMIMEKESIYITDGIENAGLSLHYIGI